MGHCVVTSWDVVVIRDNDEVIVGTQSAVYSNTGSTPRVLQLLFSREIG